MSLVAKIAFRFLGNRKSSSFAPFVAAISVFGLCLGVTALLVVTSVMNGFERELKRALTAFHGHVLMFSRAEPVPNAQAIANDIKKTFPLVKEVSPYIFAEVMLSAKKGVAGSVVEGVDLKTFDKVSQMPNRLKEGRLPTAGAATVEITLGSELARRIGAQVGGDVVLTVPFAKEGGEPLAQRLKVVGIMQLGMYEYDNKYALVELSELQKTLSVGDRVNAFKMLTASPEKSILVTEGLNDKYVYPLRAKDWTSLNRNLFYAIQLEKVVIAIILFAIVLVASFNIISTLMMLVHDKKSQISMLKALGWSMRRTFATFLLIGGFMSLLGAIAGFALAQMLCRLVQWKSIIDLPPEVYFLSRLPVEIRPAEWAIILLSSILLALGATLVPAWKVSRESPVEGLRYE
ncbi:MAG TPA: ABC transporter permease [Oligoflexia bacterium]|nr:ABC transporter permease [Oligoflexia bacterium]